MVLGAEQLKAHCNMVGPQGIAEAAPSAIVYDVLVVLSQSRYDAAR